MADLNTDVRYIKGIGEKKAQAFNKLGVFSLYDLISYFPRKYEDRSQYKPIALVMDGEQVCIRAIVADMPRLVRVRRGMELVKFRAVDESGVVDITYFNQNYVKDNISRGDCMVFFGKVEVNGSRRSMVNPVYEREGAEKGVTGRIVPVYRLCAGLNQRTVMQSVRQGLNLCGDELPDILPEEVRERCKLVQARYAFENIHFPADFEALELARRRLIFEELFVLACALGRMRGQRVNEGGIVLPPSDLEEFWRSLPFSPTNAQRRAAAQAVADMGSGRVMSRLIQGDVGSGKTLVAAALIWFTWKGGYASAFMAPTEILAEQHFATLTAMLSPLGLRVGKLTGAMSAKEKRLAKEALKNGEFDLIVGTHALFSEDVAYSRLGLVVTDEQHRFGVSQRSALIGKGERPHVLVMSATPIPRTLALIIYGDLDVSVIDELPPGRKPIQTLHRYDDNMVSLYASIRKQIELGRQVYIVYPLIHESEKMDLKDLEQGYEMLCKVFPDMRLSKVHGRMKAAEKEEEMQRFVSGETQILVATTVIEVGVNVPNASVMVIMEAQRFGLSQLHQLRGRVGRGANQSYCILVSSHKLTAETRKRLDIMCETNDGFRIAEADLKLRGPGDLEGTQQSGMAFDLKIANIARDGQLVQLARDTAQYVIDNDPDADKPEYACLWQRLRQLRRNDINWGAIS